MITNDDIKAAREVIKAASKGPGVWAADNNDTEGTAVARFMEHYRLAHKETGSHVLHQVDIDAGDEDGAFCFAVTGNGPHGAANARFVAGTLDPRLGWAACLDEIERLNAELAKLNAQTSLRKLRKA